ncbi:MAG: YraN family protein [Patescibacteria group bacterium]|nr:YraN family protein [Patescibacteria group bacterium]
MENKNKKTEKRIFGDRGENITCGYLVNRGYKIIKRNYRCKFGEIDIIAKKNNDLIFVEVKTRKNNYFGEPQEAVDYRKLERINMAMDCFLNYYKIGDEHNLRIDVVEVIFDDLNGRYTINHIEDFNN